MKIEYDFRKVSYDDFWMPYYWWMQDPVNEPYYPVQEKDGKPIYPYVYYSPNNIVQDSKGLHLITRFEPRTFDYKGTPFTIFFSTGLLSSKPYPSEYKSMYVEAKAKLPKPDFWSALWMYGDYEHPTEIDFMEQLSPVYNEYSTNVHTEKKNLCGKYVRKQNLEDFSPELFADLQMSVNTFGCKVVPNEYIKFYFNQSLIRTIRNRMNAIQLPMRVIMNNSSRSYEYVDSSTIYGELLVESLLINLE